MRLIDIIIDDETSLLYGCWSSSLRIRFHCVTFQAALQALLAVLAAAYCYRCRD